MNTIIMNLNDTLATSCNDVLIVAIISFTIIVVALIAKWAIWSWQKAKIDAAAKERKEKTENERTEKERKQQANLLEKLLIFQQKQCDAYLVNSDGKRIDKEGKLLLVDDDKVNKYGSTLEKLLGIQAPNPDAQETSQQP